MPKSKLLPSMWDIPEYFHGRIGDRAGRQRAMIHEGHLLLVLHQLPQRGVRARQTHFFYRKSDGSWFSTAEGGGIAALTKHLERFEAQLEALDIAEDKAKTADEYFALIEEMLPLKRTAANLHATLDEARKSLPNVRELINFRDHAYEIARTADLLYDAIKVGAELAHIRHAETQAAQARHLSVSAHRLNLLVSIFFPLATLAAVFGMNLKTGWEEVDPPGPFLAVCGVGLLSGAALFTLLLWRPRQSDPHGGSQQNPL